MEYRRLGKYGMRVSEVALGAWLTYGGSVENETAINCIHYALDNKVNFIDVADVYAKGKAETVVGQALQGDTYERKNLVISSKVFWPMSDDPNDSGLSRKHIMDSIDGSLKRFQQDYLDIYFCHRFDSKAPLEETIATMDDLIRDGRIRYWGTSVWTAAQLERAMGVAKEMGARPPAVEQPKYSMLERYIELEVMESTKYHGLGIVPWSPLEGGLLTGKYQDGIPSGSRGEAGQFLKTHLENPETMEKVRKLGDIAHKNNWTLSQMALAWLLRRDEISSVITGATKPEHVESNIQASGLALSGDVLAQIEEVLGNMPQHYKMYAPALDYRS